MWKFVSALVSIVFMATTQARAQTTPEYATHVLVGSWQLVKLPRIRSYTQQNGLLFLALAAEGGSYHFEPTGPAKGK